MIYAAGGGFEARIISRQKQTPNPYNTRILSLDKAYKGAGRCGYGLPVKVCGKRRAGHLPWGG